MAIALGINFRQLASANQGQKHNLDILHFDVLKGNYIADDGTKQNLQPDAYLNLPSRTKHSVICGQEPCLVYARYDEPFDLLLSPSPKQRPITP